MSKFNHNFYLDIRKPLKSGKYSIKVNLYDSELKQTSSFTIKKVAGIEVSSSKKDWEDIWINKDKKDSFGEIVGETVVYGNKFEIRTILKAKQDILDEIISRDNIFTNESIKEAFNKYVKPINVTSNVYDSFQIYIEKLQKEDRWKSARSIQTTLNIIKEHNNNEPFKFEGCQLQNHPIEGLYILVLVLIILIHLNHTFLNNNLQYHHPFQSLHY